MTTELKMNKKIFSYNLSFYYQWTIIYFVAFILYAVVRGEFAKDSFRIITNDPVVYFFIIVFFVSLCALLYNLLLGKKLEFTGTGIVFTDRFRKREIPYSEILYIDTAKERMLSREQGFRLIKIKTKHRRLSYIIRPQDFENRGELMETLKELKTHLGEKSV